MLHLPGADDAPGSLLPEKSGACSAGAFGKAVHQRLVGELSCSGKMGKFLCDKTKMWSYEEGEQSGTDHYVLLKFMAYQRGLLVKNERGLGRTGASVWEKPV